MERHKISPEDLAKANDPDEHVLCGQLDRDLVKQTTGRPRGTSNERVAVKENGTVVPNRTNYRVRQHNFLFSKLNKTHCMNQNIFIFFIM